jgi:hypothetical protein
MTIVAENDFETNTMTPYDARHTFRQIVVEVAAKAKARLPQAVNGRVESAARLVLVHDVTPQDDGSILVGSSSDPLKTYRLVGTACECQDFTRGQAPDGWCQHRIAAGIHKRVFEMRSQEPEAPVDAAPEAGGISAYCGTTPDNSAPLPEAPASVNVRLLIDGRDCQLTLRDTSETRLLARLQTVLAQYPVPQTPAQASSTTEGWCSTHGLQMTQTTKQGRSWWSHKTPEGQWCKGR